MCHLHSHQRDLSLGGYSLWDEGLLQLAFWFLLLWVLKELWILCSFGWFSRFFIIQNLYNPNISHYFLLGRLLLYISSSILSDNNKKNILNVKCISIHLDNKIHKQKKWYKMNTSSFISWQPSTITISRFRSSFWPPYWLDGHYCIMQHHFLSNWSSCCFFLLTCNCSFMLVWSSILVRVISIFGSRVGIGVIVLLGVFLEYFSWFKRYLMHKWKWRKFHKSYSFSEGFLSCFGFLDL